MDVYGSARPAGLSLVLLGAPAAVDVRPCAALFHLPAAEGRVRATPTSANYFPNCTAAPAAIRRVICLDEADLCTPLFSSFRTVFTPCILRMRIAITASVVPRYKKRFRASGAFFFSLENTVIFFSLTVYVRALSIDRDNSSRARLRDHCTRPVYFFLLPRVLCAIAFSTRMWFQCSQCIYFSDQQ